MDLQKLLDADTLKIFGVDHDLLSIYLQFAKADEGDLAVVGSDKSGAPKLPQLKQKVVNLADVWFNSPIRRSYKSICFDPRPVTHPQAPSPDKLNLWPNFRLNRQKVAKYQNFQALHLVLLHLRWVVCGSEEEFKYFLAEQAMLLQEPWHKPETCIAIGGEEGHGKTSYYENLMKPILGNLLYILLQNQEDVTGQFNSILENKLLVVCDEIFFHGDPKAANMMKNLITAAETRVSAKYKDARYTDSYAHFVLISNFVKGFINVGEKGRRYVVLEASLDHFLEALGALHNRKYDKSSYFGSLWSSFDSETLACTWANFLYNLPVGNFNPRKIPNSRLLLQQKIASMAPMVKWMMDWLYNNQIMAFNHENKTTSCAYRLHDPKPDDDKPQPNKQEMFTDVDVKVLYNSYKYHIQSSESNKKGQYSKLTPTEFEKHFVEKLPAHCRHIKHVTFTVADDKGGIRTHESKTVRLPELQTLRKHFSDCVVYGADLLWKSDLLKEDDKSDEKQPDNRLPHKLIWNMKTGVPEIKWDAKAILEDFMPLDFFGFPLAAAWKNNTWHIDPDREPVWNRNEFLQECDSQDSEEYQGKTMMQLLLSGEIYEPPKEPPKKNKRQFGDIDEPDVAGPVKKKTKPNLVE